MPSTAIIWFRRDLRDDVARALREAAAASGRAIDVYRAAQFLFDLQWRALRSRCAELGVRECLGVSTRVCVADSDGCRIW